jgi:hypothetical protein
MRLLLVFAVFAIGAALRLVALDRLPGINGDEAWYAVNVQELLAGRAYFSSTPSGNFVNPFHSGPLLAALLVAEPSFLVLRLPAAIWNLLLIALAYPLLARPLGKQAALITTALLCVSPPLVAQARIGWDPSSPPFFSLLAMAAALRDRPVLAAVAGLAGIAAHPSTVFLAPVAAVVWLHHGARHYATLTPPWRVIVRLLLAVGSGVGLVACFFVARRMARSGLLSSSETIVARVLSPASWIETGAAFLRLFSGVTSALDFSGPVDPRLTLAADAVVVAAFVVSIVVCWNGLRTARPAWSAWLLGGVGIGLAIYHVVAGPLSLRPGFERYASCLVVPLVILCGVALDALIRRSQRWGLAMTGLLWSMLLTVLVSGYSVPLAARGGDAPHHDTYRTGNEEPKLAAFRFIEQDSRGLSDVAVFAEDWWLYWPIRYLASTERDRLKIEPLGSQGIPLYPPGAIRPSYDGPPSRVYAMVFAGNPGAQAMRAAAAPVFTAADPIGRPILFVFQIPPDRVDALVGPAPWRSRGY